MEETTESVDPNWGVQFYQHGYSRTADCPIWADRQQQETWKKPGLILWDQGTETIARLTAGQALHLLEELSMNKVWKDQEISIGEPATMISLDDPNPNYEPTLIKKIHLSPPKTKQAFEFLLDREPDLELMKESEEKERAETLGRVYEFLLKYGNKAMREQEKQ